MGGQETCDDGNSDLNDGCPDGATGTCEFAKCGDGHLWTMGGQETCDDGNKMNDDVCPDGAMGTCKTAYCGDGHVWTTMGGTETCDDSNMQSADGCSATCKPECLLFVTSSVHTGNLGGLSGADEKCKNAAEKLYGTYKAVLSDSTNNAKDHAVSCAGPFIRRDNTVIAATPAILFNDMDFPAAISIDETGTNLKDAMMEERVWTGTKANSDTAEDLCGDWAQTTGNGRFGQLGAVANAWVSNGVENCGNEFRLYCVQQKE